MNKRGNCKLMTVKLTTGAIVLALASATVYGGPVENKSLSKEQKIGMATGAATGALIGGPFGAGVGFIVGALAGSGAGEYRSVKQKAESLEQQLAGAKTEFAKLAAAQATEKPSSDAKPDPMYEQLAQRLRADVLFRTGSAELDPTAVAKLAELGAVLGAYPGLVIAIDGYTDPRGKSSSNDELSQQRAMAVRAALIVGGASPDRLQVTGHGKKESTAAKDDLEAYAWERRVTLSVLPAATSQVAQSK